MPEDGLSPAFNALRPDQPTSEGPLTYSSLASIVNAYEGFESNLVREVLDAPSGSLLEHDRAKQLAMYNLVRTALRVTTARAPRQHDVWAERFTKSSIELFGAPDPAEARRLMREDQLWLMGLQGKAGVDQSSLDFLLHFHASAIGEPDTSTVSAAETSSGADLLTEIAQLFNEQYPAVVGLEPATPKTLFYPMDLIELFDDARRILAAQHSPIWDQWRITKQDATSITTYPYLQEVAVGMMRRPMILQEAMCLLVHEMLIHGLRSIHGSLTNDELMQYGLPGHLDFEEGFATLTGQAFREKPIPGPRDYYVNTALALGSIDGKPRRRKELIQVQIARVTMREQATGLYGQMLGPVEYELEARGHVNRIFKGGRGEEFGGVEPVFTKDIIYHTSYAKAEKYIRRLRAQGFTLKQVYDYLLLGSFDPTVKTHTTHVHSVTGIPPLLPPGEV